LWAAILVRLKHTRYLLLADIVYGTYFSSCPLIQLRHLLIVFFFCVMCSSN